MFSIRPLVFGLAVWAAMTSASAQAATVNSAFDHTLLEGLLTDHVVGDQVDYRRIKSDPRLEAYLALLAHAQPEAFSSRDEQLAFWINAYNAYTLKLVVSVYPVESIQAIAALGRTGDPATAKPWNIPFAVVGGKTFTLEDIEHQIIRARFRDARVHFALVCAAVSCPKLRAEAYTGAKLQAQLDDQGRWFVAHRNRLDGRRRVAELSQIFEWFAEDFGKDQTMRLDFIAEFAAPGIASSLAENPAVWQVRYNNYDWQLNDRR